MDIVIYGSGNLGRKFCDNLDKSKASLLAVIDSDHKKWGSKFGNCNISVESPDILFDLEFDRLYICTAFFAEVRLQCLQRGVDENKIFSGEIGVDQYAYYYDIMLPTALIETIRVETVKSLARYDRQSYWRNIFIETINGYKWWNHSSLSLGRWAVGYEYAYVLARVLNILRPKRVLDCGLGQTTVIINSYASYHENMFVDVIEQNVEWKEFWKQENVLSSNVNIHISELEKKCHFHQDVYIYKDFKKIIGDNKYEVISIDGPWGNEVMSRADIVECVPECLENNFVIMVDDYIRNGEKNMVATLINKLTLAGIEVEYGTYVGEKTICVIVPKHLSFILTM